MSSSLLFFSPNVLSNAPTNITSFPDATLYNTAVKSVMGFAPTSQSRAHVVYLHLELFEDHGSLALLGRIVREVLANAVALLAKDLGECLEEVDLCPRDEFPAIVVSGLTE